MSSEDAHDFRPPVEGDSRCPCPALNALANHGYLPRSGRNIKSQDLLDALRNPHAYNISQPLAELLVHGGFVLMHKFDESSISLHDFARHGFIEHNASVVHEDVENGREFAPTRCDTALLNDLLDGSSLTLDQVARKRVLLEKDAPLDPVYQEIARGEWALALDIFGRESGGEVRPEIMRMWLKENRFPEGWKPSHQQGLFDTICKSREIRQRMNEFRKDWAHSLTERRVREVILEIRQKTEQCRLPSSTD